jgi:hypothetical protein
VNPVFLHWKLGILMIFRETLPAGFLRLKRGRKITRFAEVIIFSGSPPNELIN